MLGCKGGIIVRFNGNLTWFSKSVYIYWCARSDLLFCCSFFFLSAAYSNSLCNSFFLAAIFLNFSSLLINICILNLLARRPSSLIPCFSLVAKLSVLILFVLQTWSRILSLFLNQLYLFSISLSLCFNLSIFVSIYILSTSFPTNSFPSCLLSTLSVSASLT